VTAVLAAAAMIASVPEVPEVDHGYHCLNVWVTLFTVAFELIVIVLE
jgi:hypothetical protein